jgi:hypothetical protein
VTLPLAERWNGSRWSLEAAPEPAGGSDAFVSLAAVSCWSPTACVAVGDNGHTGALVEHWDGMRWSIENTPSVVGYLTDVSCTSDTACIAVGYKVYDGRGDRTLALRWNGQRWSLLTSPSPATNSDLLSVSCSSASACVAVGGYNGQDGLLHALAERWDGSAWSVLVPARADASDAFVGVSCFAVNACVAVGRHGRPQPNFGARTLAESWDGMSWTREPIPNPREPAGFGVFLQAISCPTAASCLAVGYDDNAKSVAELRIVEPNRPFTVTHIRTSADGTVSFRAKVPGSGRIDVLETAWEDNLARAAVFLKPAPHRFASARTHVRATRPGTVTVTVKPNARGRLLVADPRYRVVLRLWVSYTPDGDSYRTIGFLGLHLPGTCTNHNNVTALHSRTVVRCN